MKTEQILAEMLISDPPPAPPSWVKDREKPYKDIIDKAYKDALYDFYKHAFKAQFVADFMSEGHVPYVPDNEMQRELLDKAAEAVSAKPPYAFITINAKPEVELEEFKKKVEKFAGRKFILAYKYIYEVRKEDHTGLHCHMLVHYTCKPYDLKRGCKSTFKTICNVNHKEILNFRWVAETDILQKIEYLKGNKQDKKLSGVKHSQEYRKKHGLKDIYESERPLQPQDALLGSVEID